MYIYICIYIQVHTHIYMYTYIHTYIYRCIHVCIYLHVYIRIYICVRIYTTSRNHSHPTLSYCFFINQRNKRHSWSYFSRPVYEDDTKRKTNSVVRAYNMFLTKFVVRFFWVSSESSVLYEKKNFFLFFLGGEYPLNHVILVTRASGWRIPYSHFNKWVVPLRTPNMYPLILCDHCGLIYRIKDY